MFTTKEFIDGLRLLASRGAEHRAEIEKYRAAREAEEKEFFKAYTLGSRVCLLGTDGVVANQIPFRMPCPEAPGRYAAVRVVYADKGGVLRSYLLFTNGAIALEEVKA